MYLTRCGSLNSLRKCTLAQQDAHHTILASYFLLQSPLLGREAMTSHDVLRSLPRFPATPHLIEARVKCEVCQESFLPREEICALPCIHQLYPIHPECNS